MKSKNLRIDVAFIEALRNAYPNYPGDDRDLVQLAIAIAIEHRLTSSAIFPPPVPFVGTVDTDAKLHHCSANETESDEVINEEISPFLPANEDELDE